LYDFWKMLKKTDEQFTKWDLRPFLIGHEELFPR